MIHDSFCVIFDQSLNISSFRVSLQILRTKKGWGCLENCLNSHVLDSALGQNGSVDRKQNCAPYFSGFQCNFRIFPQFSPATLNICAYNYSLLGEERLPICLSSGMNMLVSNQLKLGLGQHQTLPINLFIFE